MRVYVALFTMFTIVLSVFTLIVAAGIIQVSASGYGFALVAQELSEKPETYFTLTAPDAYAMQAIMDLGKPVFCSPEDTQILDLTQEYGTNKIEFENNYYEIGGLSVDPFPIFGLLPPLILGWIAWVVVAVFVFYFRRKRQTTQTQ